MLLELRDSVFHLIETGLSLFISELTRINCGLALFDHFFNLIKVLLVLIELGLVLADLLLDLAGERFGLLGHIADLLFNLGERLGERRVTRRHQPLQLINQLRERVLDRLGKLLVSLLRLRITGLGIGLRGFELRLGVLAILLCTIEVALLDLGERILALRNGGLAVIPSLLAVGVGLLRRLIEILQLLEHPLILIVGSLGLIVEGLRLLVILLRLLRELADLRDDRLQRLLDGAIALLNPILHSLDNLLQRLLDAVREVIHHLLKLIGYVLGFSLRRREVRLNRIGLLRRIVPLLLLQILNCGLARIEALLTGVIALLPVFLDVDTSGNPLAAVLVNRVFNLVFNLLELLLVLVDLTLDLVHQALGLIDISLQLVADGVLQIIHRACDRVLRLLDGIERVADCGLRQVERVLGARGNRRGHRRER